MSQLQLPASPIRALSLRQPWLWAIFDLGKRIENRVWDTTYRGGFWLHASSGCTEVECGEVVRQIKSMSGRDWRTEPSWPGFQKLERGGVCGYAEIEGVLAPDGKQGELGLRSFRDDFPDTWQEMLRWKMPDQYGFVLRNVRHFPIIPCAGRQRWFYLPPEVERAARAALEKAA